MFCTYKIITLIYEGERELAFMHAVLDVFCLLETRYERLNHVSIPPPPFPLADLLVFVCASLAVLAGINVL